MRRERRDEEGSEQMGENRDGLIYAKCHVKIRGVSPSIVNDSIEEQSRC
jgi:hypothetical protein